MQLPLRYMQPVSLEVSEGSSAGTYSSLVLSVVNEESDLLVGMPLERGREVPLEPGTAVRVLVTQKDGLHVMSSSVLGREAGSAALRLAWPTELDVIQRRIHARVEVSVLCDVQLRGLSGVPEHELSATSLDLSASGVRLAVPEALEPGTEVRLRLHLPGVGARSCEARVVRSGSISHEREAQRFWAAFEYLGALESVRADLMQFVNEVQREQLRRGTA